MDCAVPQVRHLLAPRASATSRPTPTSSLYYREASDGQLLEEGITEAGGMASFTAAGTAYATHGVNTDPVLLLLLDVRLPAHRRPDLAERRRARAKAFSSAATAGRTTLAGEGLAASGRPQPRCSPASCRPCAPTIRRSPTSSPSSSRTACAACTPRARTCFYYLTVYERDVPDAGDAGRASTMAFARGIYKVSAGAEPSSGPRVHLFGSGADPARGAARRSSLLDGARRRRRRVERHQLHRAAPRCPGVPSAGACCIRRGAGAAAVSQPHVSPTSRGR